MDATTTNRRTTLQSHHALQAKHQKQKQRHHQRSIEHTQPPPMASASANSTMCANSCRYYYDSSSPTFPDLSPPRDMPQPLLHHQPQQHQPQQHQMLLNQQQQQHQQQLHQQLQTLPHPHHNHQTAGLPPTNQQSTKSLHHHAKQLFRQQTSPVAQQQQQQLQQQQPQFPDDPDSIEFCLDEEPAAAARYYKDAGTRSRHHQQQQLQQQMQHQKTYDPQVRWSRNNIAVTMERFQPIASPSSPSESSSCTSHQDYSYAYYEPGAIMCHSNIPTPEDAAGPSVLPPPNSMRALLLKTKEKSHKTLPASRHTYTTRYGTHENIYEDVSDEKHQAARHASSEQSLTERGCTKKEFQHILNNHYRVLEELNLSVEELLMSSSPPSEPPLPTVAHLKRMTPVDALTSHFVAMELKEDMRSPVSELIVGEDSGFSGSSSGASYIGSLRNYKTAITRSLRRSSAPNCGSAGTIYGSCRTAKIPMTHEARQGSFYSGKSTGTMSAGGSGGGAKMNLPGGSGDQQQMHHVHRSPESVSSVSSSASSQKSSKFALWGKRS